MGGHQRVIWFGLSRDILFAFGILIKRTGITGRTWSLECEDQKDLHTHYLVADTLSGALTTTEWGRADISSERAWGGQICLALLALQLQYIFQKRNLCPGCFSYHEILQPSNCVRSTLQPATQAHVPRDIRERERRTTLRETDETDIRTSSPDHGRFLVESRHRFDIFLVIWVCLLLLFFSSHVSFSSSYPACRRTKPNIPDSTTLQANNHISHASRVWKFSCIRSQAGDFFLPGRYLFSFPPPARILVMMLSTYFNGTRGLGDFDYASRTYIRSDRHWHQSHVVTLKRSIPLVKSSRQ